MFERFTERARRVISLAQEEAKRLNHSAVGTEHILLGIIREGEGVASKVLESLNISPDRVRAEIESAIGRGERTPYEEGAFTPRAKKVLELALDEARRLGHNYIGTEHLLLGLIREGEGVAARVLEAMGADLARVRAQAVNLLGEGATTAPAVESSQPPHGVCVLSHSRVTAPRRRLVILHGAFGAGRNWTTLARRLVKARPEWAIVLADLRLHGGSCEFPGVQEFPRPHTLETAAADIAALAQMFGVPFDAVLGHSLGGKVALSYAGRTPQGLRQV